MPHTETWIEGVWYPSVSTIIDAESKPWLQVWHDKWGPLADRKVAVSNAIGTAFHDCVEQYLSTGQFEVRMTSYSSCIPRVVGMMKSFINWAMNVEGTIDYTELRVVSRTHTYSGTLDAVGTFAGRPTLYDWKTSSQIYDEMALQLSAYSEAYREERGIETKQGLIVHVSKAKPRFKLTVKVFKLGKRVFNRFLRLRARFDDTNVPDLKEGVLDA